MERRLLVVLGAFAVAVVAVGLSAAATRSKDESVDGESTQPAADVRGVQPEKKAVSRTPPRKANEPVATSRGRSQSAKEVESYWTEERMEDAQPMEKTRQGGTPSSSPAPSGTTVPGSAPTEKPTPQKSSTRKSQSPLDTGVSTRPAATPNPGYWTDDTMADAQPMEKTRPGGSGSQGSPDPGGSTAPGSPPP
jgi:hypothetical protein